MKEFLIEALNSRVGERLVDCLFVCVIVVVIQYFYNKKLAEYQIQFKYWHKEKAKAIKTIYNNFTDLSTCLQTLLSYEKNDNGSKDIIAQKTEAMKSLTSITKKSFEDWHMLNLYLDNKDNEKISDFLQSVREFSDLYDPNINNFSGTIAEQGDALFLRTLNCLYDLRMRFRKTLMVKDDDAKKVKRGTKKGQKTQ